MIGKKGVWVGAAALLAAGIAAFVIAGGLASRPALSERWALYVEQIEPTQKLVVLASDQRYAASKEFSAKLLSVANIKASIDLTAWAEVSYFVDLSDASLWSVDWDRRAKTLTLVAPEPDCLLPSVKTETIEIRSKGANLVTNVVFKLKAEAEKMRSELSADFHRTARAALSDAALRQGMRAGLEGFARGFCASVLRATPSAVVVRFRSER